MRLSVICYKPSATLFAIGHSRSARATRSKNFEHSHVLAAERAF
jgi:hypothetical protein